MGVPLRANVDAETQRMILGKTKVIRRSFVHEGEPAGWSRVPGMSRNDIQSGLQLRHESGPFFGLLAFVDVDRHAIPLDDASLSITQRLTTSMVPTKLAVRPAQTDHTLVRSSGLNGVIEGLCGFWKVIRVHERLPTNTLEILKSHAAVVQEALIDMGRLAVGPVDQRKARHRVDDLTELVFAFPKGLLRLSLIINIDQDAVPTEHPAIACSQWFCRVRRTIDIGRRRLEIGRPHREDFRIARFSSQVLTLNATSSGWTFSIHPQPMTSLSGAPR